MSVTAAEEEDTALAPTESSTSGPLAMTQPCEVTDLGLAQVLPDPGPSPARTRRSKFQVPPITTEVRRSTRSTRYDGFRVPQISDVRAPASKVKPRQAPSASSSSSVFSPVQAPPPTPLRTMQEIGINRCAVPPSELTEEALLAATIPDNQAGTDGEEATSLE